MYKTLFMIVTFLATTSLVQASREISKKEYIRRMKPYMSVAQNVTIGDTWLETHTKPVEGQDGCFEQYSTKKQVIKETRYGIYVLHEDIPSISNCPIDLYDPASLTVIFIRKWTREELLEFHPSLDKIFELGNNKYRFVYKDNIETITDLNAPSYRWRVEGYYPESNIKIFPVGVNTVRLRNDPITLCTYLPVDDGYSSRPICEDDVLPESFMGKGWVSK